MMTFKSLFFRHGIKSLDLLQIDAEGYDYTVIQLFDFERLRSLMIQLEMHVMSKQEQRESRARLEHYG